MTNSENKPPATLATFDGFSGYEDRVEGENRQQGGSVIKGMLVKFTNDAAWIDTNDDELPAELELVVVDVLRVVTKFVDQKLVEQRILAPGEMYPDIEALNAATPKSEWSTGPSGEPRGPWQKQHVLYLLNLETMDRYTYPTGTTGGAIATRELVDKTNWVRRLRGPNLYPRVALRDVFMNTKFGGRQRPHFEIKGWVQLGDDGAKALPTPAPTPLPPMPGVKEMPEPTLSEHMGGDEVPTFDDPLPEIDGRVADAGAEAAQSAPRKPAAQSHTTKRGVTKFAGGRRSSGGRQEVARPLFPACHHANVIYRDIETRSTLNLTKVGPWRYAGDATTGVWCTAYAVDDWTRADMDSGPADPRRISHRGARS